MYVLASNQSTYLDRARDGFASDSSERRLLCIAALCCNIRVRVAKTLGQRPHFAAVVDGSGFLGIGGEQLDAWPSEFDV